jgi:hypothetical protein
VRVESGAQVWSGLSISMTAIALKRCNSVDCAAFRIPLSSLSITDTEPAIFPVKMQRQEPRKCDEHESWVPTQVTSSKGGSHRARVPTLFRRCRKKGNRNRLRRTPRVRVTTPPSREKDKPFPLQEMGRVLPPRRVLVWSSSLRRRRRNGSQRVGRPVYFFDLAAPSTSLTLRAAHEISSESAGEVYGAV